MIWNEFNENKILKTLIKHYNQCLLNIIKTHIFGEII
jgi:hypothetical protein